MIASILSILFVLSLSPSSLLCDKADSLYLKGALNEAEEVATLVAAKAYELSDTTELIKAYCILADIAMDKGNDLEAVDYYNKCVDYSSFGEPMFMLSSSLYNIASIYYQNDENEKAYEYIMKSILVDSRRESDSILALRYLLAADILFKQGDYDKALEMADKGKEYSRKRKNSNVEGRLMLVQAKCHEALAGPNPDWSLIEAEYRSALDVLSTRFSKEYHYGVVNPYAPEFLYRLGLALSAQGKDAKSCFIEAIEYSRRNQTMHGTNPMIEIECCNVLADILNKEGDRETAGNYLARAQSLSYVPYLHEMGIKLSLNQMEFIRREKESEIERQKERSRYLFFIVILLATSTICLLLMYRYQLHQKKMIWQKNSQLIKLDLQKDKLIGMLQNNTTKETDAAEIKAIADDVIPCPDIKLSKREAEVLTLCCKGLISKEIAYQLNVSVRTVESHKSNLFRKIGVNTTNELIAFAFKYGFHDKQD